MQKNKFGLSTQTLRHLNRLKNKNIKPPHGFDKPEYCRWGETYWHHYHYNDYTYRYNDVGYRSDIDYRPIYGSKINICIGDSFTLNRGGPIDHSWPTYLAKYFKIPTLNFGVDGSGIQDHIDLIEKLKSFNQVQNIFILYNPGETDLNDQRSGISTWTKTAEANLIEIKKQGHLPGTYWQFIPPWMLMQHELKVLYENFPAAHAYLKYTNWKDGLNFNSLINASVVRQSYMDIAGPSWPSYETFCEYIVTNRDLKQVYPKKFDQELIKNNLNEPLTLLGLTNRDGRHLNKHVNQVLANYFYQQAKKNNLLI